jgi:hypothetical protein
VRFLFSEILKPVHKFPDTVSRLNEFDSAGNAPGADGCQHPSMGGTPIRERGPGFGDKLAGEALALRDDVELFLERHEPRICAGEEII